jgi:hypothetical protein
VLFKILKSGLFQFKVTLFAGYRFNVYALNHSSVTFQILFLPENRPIAFVLIGLCVLFLATLIYLAVCDKLKFSIPFLLKVEPGHASSSDGKASKASATRGYRKVLYVKVTYLSDRTKAPAPFYRRTVKRLAVADRSVPVFDEAVYYTLELLPKKGPVSSRKDRSSGVVDSRIVIPWHDDVVFRDSGAAKIKELVQLETDKESDTFLTVSHFENGLQGKDQDIGTDVPEDAEYVRLLVDFSSVPNASRFIAAERAFIRYNGQEVIAPIAQPSPALFSVECKDVKKASVVNIDFTFDWSRNA